MLFRSGLRRQGGYVPEAGWWRLMAQVLVACAVLGAWLGWAAQAWDWAALHDQALWRIVLMLGVLVGSAVLYFGVLALTGLKLRALLRR